MAYDNDTIDCGLILDGETVSAVTSHVQSMALDTGRRLTVMGASVSWTGTLVATLHWQGRNQTTESWSDVKDSTGSIIYFSDPPAGSASNAAQSFKDSGFRYYRVYVTYTSGTGTITIFVNTKVEF